MKLTDISIRRPVTIVMLVCIIILLGFISLTNLDVDLFPDMNMPAAIVVTEYEGTAPEEIENLVTKPLEETLGTVNRIDSIESQSMMGTSLITAQFDWGTDMDFATLDIREKIDMIKSTLPDEVEDSMIVKMDPNMMPIMTLALSGDMHYDELKEIGEDTVKNRLERIEGVASVDISGGLDRQINVSIKPEVMQAYDISINQITQTLRGENLNVSGGRVAEGDKEYLVRVLGEFDSVDDIENIRLNSSSGERFKLGDIAQVEDGVKDVNSYNTIDGKPSVGIFVQKQSGANTVTVASKVNQEMNELENTLPDTIEMTNVVDQSEFINDAIYNMVQNIIIGGILAILILFIFLRNIQSTIIIGIAIPISIITAFTLVYFRGLSLNMMTLGGLALGVGMMVDNAIVILENIFRHRQKGDKADEAASSGTSEMALAITASTLTTIAVFIPIIFVEGLASELFSPLAMTVSFALLASLGVALTLIPMMSSKLLPSVPQYSVIDAKTRKEKLFAVTERWLTGMDSRYRKVLKWSLWYKKIVVLVTLVVFICSLALLPLVGVEFIPQMDSGQLSVVAELPKGTKLERTEEIVEQTEEIIKKHPEVKTIFTTVGSSAGQATGYMSMGSESYYASVDIELVDMKNRERSTLDVVEAIREEVSGIPGAEFSVEASDPMMGGGGTDAAPVEVEIKGDEFDELEEIANDVSGVVRSVSGTREVETSLDEGAPEVQVLVDRVKTSKYGLSASEVSESVRTAVHETTATQYRTGDDEIDISVRLSEDNRESVSDLMDLKLMTGSGGQVPLSEVAEIKIAEGPSTIERKDQERTVTVSSKLHGRDLGSVIDDIQSELDNYVLPAGYSIEYGGESQQMADAFGDLSLALILAIVLVYMILAGQFESFSNPFAVMFSLPVTIVGVVLALLITGRSLSVPAFIGLIVLAGIVVNNAIVLVDYINQIRNKGYDRNEAILLAGPHRLRPILMTAMTTILAMVPLALGLGEGSETSAPMGTAVIGGLITSTFLTLLVVPVMYVIFDSMGEWIKSKITFLKQEEKNTSV